jgi:DNA-binding IscR family transcriptional regulator
MERLAEGASYGYREALALWTMIELGKRFDAGLPGLSAEASATAWNVPLRLLNDTLNLLEDARLVVQCASKPPTYQPARSLEKIAVSDVLISVREAGRDPSALREHNAFSALLGKVNARPSDAADATIADLIREMGETSVLEFRGSAERG